MKKGLKVGVASLAALMTFGVTGCGKDKLDPLPAARKDECAANVYTNACATINKDNLYEYMGRSDVAYIDLRDFADYQFSHLEGFTNVQFFADIWNQNGVAGTNHLFNKDYTPAFADSVEILETLIPKDKTVFLMCAGGGRVVWMMDILELNGWDMSKIYNVGGMNNYKAEGFNQYKVSKDKTALTFKTGTWSETVGQHTYTATAHVSVDKDGKITNVYVTGDSEYTAGTTAEWTQDTWVNAKYSFTQKLIGKTKAEVEALMDNNGNADGADVVTGASLSSNRVYKAVIAALNA